MLDQNSTIYYKYFSQSLNKEVVSMASIPSTTTEEKYLSILFQGERADAEQISWSQFTEIMELKKQIALYGEKGSDRYKRKQIEELYKEIYSDPKTSMELRKEIYERIMFDTPNILQYYEAIKQDDSLELKELY